MSSPSSAPASAVLLPELPAGLLRDKGEARDLFLRHGLPQRGSPAAERWKYTLLGKMAGTRLHLPHEGQADSKITNTIANKRDEIERFPEASLLLFVDGRLQDHARAPNITPYAGLPRVTADQPLAALNVGSRCEAWRVVLDEGTPFLHVLFLASETDDAVSSPLHSLALLQTRLRIEVASGSTTLVQSREFAVPCWSNDLIEFEVAEGAHCEHVVLQAQSEGSCGFSRTLVRIAEKGSYAHISALRGEGLTRQEVSVALEGVEASCKLHGGYRARGKGHIDNDTEIFHNRARCTSDALYKGVLEDAGRGVFHGKIFVAQEAQETQGYQMSRALLLSERAQAYHKPELEIYADDVKCSHGATIGALDEEQMFYLRSRGIAQAQAEALLLEAFLTEALCCQQKTCAEALQAHMQSE